ncbi:hypothetical protein M8A51_04700 [Schlegelella sp. S2-27]|uniref:Uncharacterized protein n=1 Tax=Caldimonas mangrovi TaxID=2944811 RepID=A0ABT0YKE0_9BURK|nr:hypothetical protein [Caldimonas mangrovi]MCM5678829.1 hypothetical protein [Caldimonas mangrovi]
MAYLNAHATPALGVSSVKPLCPADSNEQAFVPAHGSFCARGHAIAVTMRPDQAHSHGRFEAQLWQRLAEGGERLVATELLAAPATRWNRAPAPFRAVLRPGRIHRVAPAAAPPEIGGSACRVVIVRMDLPEAHGFSRVIEVAPA